MFTVVNVTLRGIGEIPREKIGNCCYVGTGGNSKPLEAANDVLKGCGDLLLLRRWIVNVWNGING